MATNNLKFFHVSEFPKTNIVEGGIYFNSANGEIAVGTATGLEHYSGVVKDVNWVPSTDPTIPGGGTGTLTITKFDDSSISLDFSDVASASKVAKDIEDAIADLKTTIDAYTVNGKGIATNPVLGGADIDLTGYTKAGLVRAIAATDSVNTAIGILEKKVEDAVAGGVNSVVAGNGIAIDNTDTNNPVVSAKIDTTSEKLDGVDVLTVGTNGLKISGIADKIAAEIGKLDKSDTAVTNEYVSAVSETDGVITVSRETLPVTGVASGDKILGLSGTLLSAGLSFSYNSTDKKIYLYGSAEDSAHKIGEVDCTDFIKDGILYDQIVAKATGASMEVTFPKGDKNTYTGLTEGNTYIFLEFNDGLGETDSKSFDKLDATDLVDVYTAGNGLELSNNEFSIKLNGTSAYLTVGASGLAFNDTALHTEIDSRISTEIGKLDAVKSNTAAGSGSADSTQIKVTVEEVDGKLDSVAVVAPIFAVPDDIDDLESKLIGTAGDAKTADTIWGAKNYGKDAADTAEANANSYTNSAIAGLDATVTNSITDNGITASVVEEDGKLKSVTVSIAEGTYATPADITAAIAGLDSSASNDASGAGDGASNQIKVTVSEVDGKLSAVTVKAPAFDLSGAAATAEQNAKDYTDASIEALDATESQVASATNGLALEVVETDGLITGVSGSMNWCEW